VIYQAPKILIGIPVYNEEQYVTGVIEEVRHYAEDILVVDDGSTDRTPELLGGLEVEVIRNRRNRGYGRAMQCMLCRARKDGYDWLITMDCDEQHEPRSIPDFVSAIQRDEADVISGSRYLTPMPLDDAPPGDRRRINRAITDELNARLGLSLTDGFCGFKAYRVDGCGKLSLDVDGYEFPMQFWVQAVAHGLRIEEIPVRLIYHDPTRCFGGLLDDPTTRLAHYRAVMHRELKVCEGLLPAEALEGVEAAAGCEA